MDGQCCAQTRAGAPCKRRPVPGRTRCKLHGGASTGPRTAAGRAEQRASATTHGIYANAIDGAEIEAVSGTDVSLDWELLVARVQLRRALKVWDRFVEGDALQLEEHTTVTGDRPTETLRRRRPDLWGIVDRCLGRIGRLTEQRAHVEEVAALSERLDELLKGKDRRNA